MKTTWIWIIVAIVVIGGGIIWYMSSQNSNMQMAGTQTQATTTTTQPQQGVMVGGAEMTPDLNIVQNAMNANNVTTLVAAVQAAGLATTLEGPGPFTVFAPDNNAFTKLPAGTVNTLLMPANKSELTDILEYHVVAGRYTSADLYDGETLTTVEGGTLTVHKSADGTIMINNATVEIPDIISSNGVTFLIDTVLMPPAKS